MPQVTKYTPPADPTPRITIGDVKVVMSSVRGVLGDLDNEIHLQGAFGDTWCDGELNEETQDYYDPGGLYPVPDSDPLTCAYCHAAFLEDYPNWDTV